MKLRPDGDFGVGAGFAEFVGVGGHRVIGGASGEPAVGHSGGDQEFGQVIGDGGQRQGVEVDQDGTAVGGDEEVAGVGVFVDRSREQGGVVQPCVDVLMIQWRVRDQIALMVQPCAAGSGERG